MRLLPLSQGTDQPRGREAAAGDVRPGHQDHEAEVRQERGQERTYSRFCLCKELQTGEQDNQSRLPGEDTLNRTARTGQPEKKQDSQIRTIKTEQSEQERQRRTPRAEQSEQET